MLQDRKRQNRKRNTAGSALQKNEQPCITAPRPHYVVTKLSHVCLAHPLRCCKKKTQKNKASTTGSAPQETNNHVPMLSQRRDKLENLKLRVVVRPRTRTRTLLTPPLCFLRAFRWSRPSTLSWCRFALASLGDARAADALRFVVVKHAAAITVEPPATSSLTDVAMRGLRRSVSLMAQFTVRTRHGAPLSCAELFGSAAARVLSFLCCVCLLFVCPCVSNLHD